MNILGLSPPKLRLPTRPKPTEEQRLKLGYFAKMLERWPFNKSIGNCRDEGSAILWNIEKTYLDDMQKFSYDRFFGEGGSLVDAPKEEKEYMKRLWDLVTKLSGNLTMQAGSIEGEYRRGPPEKPSRASFTTVDSYPYVTLNGHYRTAAAAIIDGKPIGEVASSRAQSITEQVHQIAARKVSLAEWRKGEKSRRKAYFEDFKNFITCYRLWHEMLLENIKVDEAHKLSEKSTTSTESSVESKEATSPVANRYDFSKYAVQQQEGKKDRYVRFSLSPEEREELARSNRYLRLIDVIYQIVPCAQNLHHQQDEGRMREEEDVPYIYHPIRVLGYSLEDVIPFVIDSDEETDYLLNAIADLMHDVGEDTTQSVPQAIRFFEQYVDHIDQSIDNDSLIKSGFPMVRDREFIKNRMLKLVPAKSKGKLKSKLLALSKFTVLGRDHYVDGLKYFPLSFVKSAYKQEQKVINDERAPGKTTSKLQLAGSRARAPQERVMAEVLDINAPIEDIDLDALQSDIRKPGNAPLVVPHFLQEFPETDDPKLDAYLLRMHTLSKDSIRQKLFDRAQNVSSLGSFDGYLIGAEQVKKKRKTLRGTVSRLLAYAIFDHDHHKYPLHNALPRLINETAIAYQRFFKESPELVEDKDRMYYAKLRDWQDRYFFKQVPPFYEETLRTYNAEKEHRSIVPRGSMTLSSVAATLASTAKNIAQRAMKILG